MSTIQWAQRIRCDWPGCQSEGNLTLGPDRLSPTMPAGWLSLSPTFTVLYGDGRRVNELCTIHSNAHVSALVRAFTQEKTATS